MIAISTTVPPFLIIRSTLITGQSDNYWNTNEQCVNSNGVVF